MNNSNEPTDGEQLEARLRGLLTPAASPERVRSRLEQSVAAPAKIDVSAPRRRFGVLDFITIAALIVICVSIAVRLMPAKPTATAVVGADDDTPPLTSEQKARFAVLLENLKSDDFDTRETAFRELSEADERLLPLLAEVKTDDADLKRRLNQLRVQIETRTAHKLAIARLDAFEPDLAAMLGNKVVSERQKAAIAWATTGDRTAKVRLLVEVFPKVDYGPLLHGCSDALNVLTAEDAFTSRDGMSWASSTDNSLTNILTRSFEDIKISKAARTVCDQVIAPAVYNSISSGKLLGDMLDKVPAVYCYEPDGKLHILDRHEAAAFWRTWWDSAQQHPKWQRDTATPTPENIALWARDLDGGDAQTVLLNMRRLLDAWDQVETPSIVQKLAVRDTTGARRARELQMLRELRNAGTIYFNVKLDKNKMAAHTMHADGSGTRPLFPNSAKSWWVQQELDGRLIMGVWGTEDAYLWSPGMATPELIAPNCAVFCRAPDAPGAWLVWLSGPKGGAFHVFDLATRTLKPLVDDAGKAVVPPEAENLEFSPDRKRCVYSIRVGEKPANSLHQTRSLWIADLQQRRTRELLPPEAGRGLHGYSRAWSPDGVWLAVTGAIPDDKVYRGYFWLIDTITGERQNLIEGYRSCPSFSWDRKESSLYFLRVSKPLDYRMFDLVAWKSGAMTEIPLTDDMRKSTMNHSASVSMHVDGRVIFAASKNFLIDPAGKLPPAQTSDERNYYRGRIEHKGQTWELVECDGLPGTFERQVVLLSADGKHLLPLTNVKQGAFVPVFVPAQR